MSDYGMLRKLRTKYTEAKPVIIGAILGAGVAVVAGFTSGAVVTSGTVAREVAKERVSAVASVCAQQAGAHWKDQGNEQAGLTGWSNDARDELAQRFTTAVDDVPRAEVVRLCSRMLKPA